MKPNLEDYPPEKVAPICGIPAKTPLKEVARLFAGSPASMILWGMGISQHFRNGNARCLISCP
ncbi:MAG: hypothetical protein Ct9H90mP9_4960 [Pseudomonadota bacterium]|nr:MAG: hypothetical protein Ct9H90mP9_4960 [Pseudomonadota bacterium]